MDFLRQIEPYQRVTLTPRAFFSFVRQFRLKGDKGLRWRCLFGPVSFLFVFISGSSGLMKQVKGWRRFQDRGRVGAASPTCRPRSLMSTKREPGVHGSRVMNPGPTRDLAEKTGRSIRCPARIRPLHQARTGFELKPSGRVPALHASEYLTIPAFKIYPFGFAHARRMRPLSVERLDNAFHPATGTIT